MDANALSSKTKDNLQERNVLLHDTLASYSNSCDGNLKELFPEIIWDSEIMEKILAVVLKIAKSHSSVLLLGESGTGKELIAQAIHRLSPRANKCFIAINCSAIPENLLEAELFGYEKGAFTGADKKRYGHFAAANQGTIFLDEIGDMPLRLQAKLLRVLQEKQYTPIGSNQCQQIDVRIIAATNANLEESVKNQTFRLDLYYRLNVLPIILPPLRQRSQDIGLLLEYFIEHMNRIHMLENPCWIDAKLKQRLQQATWPGNVRQLQNLVERMVIISGGGKLEEKDLPEEFIQTSLPKADFVAGETKVAVKNNFDANLLNLPREGFDMCKAIEMIENDLIMQALERTNNNKNQAAKLLGLNRTTLVERIKKRQIRQES